MVVACLWGIYILTLLQLIHDACRLNWHILISWRWSTNRRDPLLPDLEKRPELLILVPVLREQKQLPKILQSLRTLPYPGSKRIIVVTTEREIAENHGVRRGTTVELAENSIAELQRHYPSLYGHIHYPKVVGNKASQLNHALHEITQKRKDLSTCYIGVYDADSCPASDTLLHIWELVASAETVGQDWPIAMQQPSLFLGNFQCVSWYLQLEALFETRWVLGHEICQLRASTRSGAQSIPPYAYCVGHGMFIRADFLQRTGGFPEPSEDVPLGHRLIFLGVPIHPLPVYDVCDVAPRVSTLIRQSGFWFANAPLIWREYNHVKRLHLPTKRVRSAILLMKGMLDLFSWIYYPLHLISLIALLLHGIPILYAVFSILACYLDAGVGTVLMLSQFAALSSVCGKTIPLRFSVKVWFVVCSPLRSVVRGLAPLLACWYLVQSRILKQVNVLPKTTR